MKRLALRIGPDCWTATLGDEAWNDEWVRTRLINAMIAQAKATYPVVARLDNRIILQFIVVDDMPNMVVLPTDKIDWRTEGF